MDRESLIDALTQKENELEQAMDAFWINKTHVVPGGVDKIRRLEQVRRFISSLRHSFRFHPEPNYILRKYQHEIERLIGKPVYEVI